MARIKSYTDIEQSKKLAEILPLETADYYHAADTGVVIIAPYITYCGEERCVPAYKGAVPCWSLAALLDVLPKKYYPIKDHETDLILGKPKDKWCVLYWDTTGMQHGEQTLEDNPLDACVNMIIKLNELNLL